MNEYTLIVTCADEPSNNEQDVLTEKEVRQRFPKFAEFILDPAFQKVEWLFDLTQVKIERIPA